MNNFFKIQHSIRFVFLGIASLKVSWSDYTNLTIDQVTIYPKKLTHLIYNSGTEISDGQRIYSGDQKLKVP